MKKAIVFFKAFFISTDKEYEYYAENYKATSIVSKVFYLCMFFIPGIVAYLAINVKSNFDFLCNVLGVSGHLLQFIIFILITFGLHIFLPVFLLMKVDKLNYRQVFSFLSLKRFDLKGFLIAIILLLIVAIITEPYLILFGRPLSTWIHSNPVMLIPSHSIFNSYEAMFSFSTLQIVMILIGNHLGEELYYRGYLMKKTAFLGKYTWVINGIFFSLYHLWQIPQTWPLVGLSLSFGLLMAMRKNTYVLIFFHFLMNYAWPFIYHLIYHKYLVY